ncbi:elongation factor Ts [Gemmatimonadetes bacterium T265]|nr:elongation factor Ts [Gemmatimonadetes bacterium T265]
MSTATFTAKDVQELRQRTGAGMMDCKKALEENQGNMEASVDYLRKKGIAKAEKRAGKSTSEGVIRAEISPDGSTGVLVEINCETDFVARNDDFQAIAKTVADQALASPSATDAAGLLSSTLGGGQSVEEYVKESSAKMGEAVNVRRVARYAAPQGVVGSYVHFNGKIGVLVEVQAANGGKDEALTTLAKTLAEHVAAAAPVGIDRDTVPAEVVERERAIFVDQVRASGKPEAMIDKIVTGKIEAYYKDVALLHQAWIREPKTSIQQVVDQTAKQVGAPVTVKRFTRFQLGQE